MRASVIAAPRTSALQRVQRPQPGPGQVLIELEGSGVCASSIPVWEGRSWFEYRQAAGAPGHEGWGRVAAIGEGVTRVKPGDRVAALSYRAHAEFNVANQAALVPLPDS